MRGKDCITNFCPCFKKYAWRIFNFKKKKIKSLTNEQQESYENLLTEDKYTEDIMKIYWKYTEDKEYPKIRDHCR